MAFVHDFRLTELIFCHPHQLTAARQERMNEMDMDWWDDAQQDLDRHEDDCQCEQCLKEDEEWGTPTPDKAERG